MVGVEVGLYRPVRVEDAEVRAEPRRRLVLGAVHDDLSALPRPGLEREVVDGLRAGHRAAVPAAVRHSLREELLVCVGADVVDVLVASELVVVDRKKVVGVHYLHKVRRSDRAHLVGDDRAEAVGVFGDKGDDVALIERGDIAGGLRDDDVAGIEHAAHRIGLHDIRLASEQ